MTEAEFQDYFEHMLVKYAASNVTSGNWTAEEAAAKSAENLARLLPDGLATKDTHLAWPGMRRAATAWVSSR